MPGVQNGAPAAQACSVQVAVGQFDGKKTYRVTAANVVIVQPRTPNQSPYYRSGCPALPGISGSGFAADEFSHVSGAVGLNSGRYA